MPLYRKKPIIVDAMQYHFGQECRGVYIGSSGKADPYCITIHGQKAYVSEGDWIIAESDGIHYYPCRDDVFRSTYDPA